MWDVECVDLKFGASAPCVRSECMLAELIVQVVQNKIALNCVEQKVSCQIDMKCPLF